MPKKRVKKRVPAKLEKPPLVRQARGRWAPGQSGNPAGGKKGVTTLTKILREYGERELHIGGESLLAKEHLAKTAYTAILEGYWFVDGKKVTLNNADRAKMLRWLYDRVDGKSTENVQISTPEAELSSEDYKEAMKELAEWKRHREKKSGN